MASRKRKKNKVDWPAICRRWEASGLTQKEFCEAEGLEYSTFRHWRSRGLRRKRSSALAVHQQAEPPAVQGFVSLGFLEEDLDLGEPELPDPEVTVELPFGVVLRFRGLAR